MSAATGLMSPAAFAAAPIEGSYYGERDDIADQKITFTVKGNAIPAANLDPPYWDSHWYWGWVECPPGDPEGSTRPGAFPAYWVDEDPFPIPLVNGEFSYSTTNSATYSQGDHHEWSEKITGTIDGPNASGTLLEEETISYPDDPFAQTQYCSTGVEPWQATNIDYIDPADTSPPQTTLLGATIRKLTGKAVFRFTGYDDKTAKTGLRYQCKLGGAFRACTSPTTYRHLNSGRYTFKVRAIDQADNKDPSPATKTFRIRRG